jgi:hypothetical protein
LNCLEEDDIEHVEDVIEIETDSESAKPPKVSSLEKHANEKWESILLYIARGTGTDNSKTPIFSFKNKQLGFILF